MKLIHHVIENSIEAFPSILPTSRAKAPRHSRRSSEPNSHARLDRSPLPFALAVLLATFGLLKTTFATVQSPLPDSFNPGARRSVSSLALQADGKILTGGEFTTLDGQPRQYLGRLNPDGTLDLTFNTVANGRVNSLVVQADGKVLVGGYFTTLGGQTRTNLGRLNPDGTLDSSFNPGAGGAEYASVYCLALQTDGRILVGGFFNTLGGQLRSRIGRLNPDGTLDSTFNPGANDAVYSLVVQTDGKVLVGGRFTTLGGQTRTNLGRLNPDGAVDYTFNSGANYRVNALALQADGRILVGGYFTTLGGQTRKGIGRLDPDGTLDFTFDPGIAGIISEDDQTHVSSLVVQADGKILVGGTFTILGGQPRKCLGRLNPSGALDTTFNTVASYAVESLAVQADGKILVGGYFTTLGGQTRNGIGRLDNTTPATEILSHDGSTITWLRGGASPEVWRTTFETSADGLNWTLLGDGTRISGGWQLPGLAVLPAGTLRARGYAAGGLGNASGWFVETTWSGPVAIRLRMVREGPTVVLNWTGGQGPYQVERTADLSRPDAWQNVGPTSHTNSMALPLGPDTLFLRVRGQ